MARAPKLAWTPPDRAAWRTPLASALVAGDKPPSMRANPNSGYLLIILTAALWSGNSIIGRGTHELIPPVGLSFWRFLVALPILLLIARPHLLADLRTALRAWPTLLFLAVLGISTYNSFIYIGLNYTTAINATLINTARPAIIVLMSLAFLRVPVTAMQVLGLSLGLVGTGVIVFRGNPGALLNLQLNIGDLWVLAATIAWAVYTVFLHKRPPIHPASFMALITGIGIVVMLPFYLFETVFIEPMPLVPVAIYSVLFLALIPTVMGHLCYNRSVELLGANRAGLISYMIPVFGVTLAILLRGETFHLFHAIGIALLIAGTVLGSRGAVR
jgi:drug/metabolite transporter (DMT)-like permease